MVQRRMVEREALGPDHRPLMGRGYELLDERGAVLRGRTLEPDSAGEAAVVTVRPTTPAERDALKQRTFGLDRPVRLEGADDGTVGMFDADGQRRAGQVVDGSAEATARLLRDEPERSAWVCWEWLTEDGREHVDVALTSAEHRPQPLPPPAVSTAGVEDAAAAGGRRWMWVALAALVVIAVVAFFALS